jgi:hypothetical protein
MPLSEEQWTVLAHRMKHALIEVAPGWTEPTGHDPGITLLQVLDFALVELLNRSPALDAEGRRLAQRVAERALELVRRRPDDADCGPGLQRVRYAAGMILAAEDLQADQDYFRSRLSRRNRLLHGAGIVSGLAVQLESDGSGDRVIVAPGLALDALGNEIEVDQPTVLPLPAAGDAQLVLVRHVERPCRPVATATNDPGAVQATRMVESFALELAQTAGPDALAIARVRRVGGRWRLDKSFKPAHTR